MTPEKTASKKKSGRFSARSGRPTVIHGQSTDEPQFGQSAPTPDPTGFPIPITDTGDYSKVNATLLQPVPQPRGSDPEPLLTPYLVAQVAMMWSRCRRAATAMHCAPPTKVNPTLTVENYDDMDYGYLRIVADTGNLLIEYHPASDGAGAKTPNDTVTVNLKTRALS